MSMKTSHLRTVGETYHQFKLLKVTPIPELQSVLRELIHEPTGARVMHIDHDDAENLFCLSFQTLPSSSNGVAHILEHTVLCGSKKFPVKDPFFAMNRRSLNTFMNALTGMDFTCYPAASQIHKDFYNLLDVYLDAVFHPELKELSFLQEGHRLEFSEPGDISSPLEYKGIVYNEMKGALSSASARLIEMINQSLFPDVCYGFNSGGDPKDIPNLSYEELKQFHELYYHPSRCLFFFYGNMPLQEHLDFIAEHTLNHCHLAAPLPQIPYQPRFKTPVYLEASYPIAAEEDQKNKTWIAFCWLTCHVLEQEEALALNILEIILMDTDASVLKKALLNSGLCKQVESFIDVEINEIPWGIMIKGCEPADADTLENIMKNTLKELCYTGIALQQIENAIHQLEFYRSEITGDHHPFGLSLFMRAALLKQHGADPAEALEIHSLFDRLRKMTLENANYFVELIQKYLLDNPHFVRIVMKPDPLLSEKEAQEESRKLAIIKESLSQKDKEALVKKAKELASFQKEQEEGENEDLLPKVTLADVPVAAKDYPLIQEKVGVLDVFHHNAFTNEIVYADLVFDLPLLTEEEFPYLRLLTVVLTQMGCNGRNWTENLDYIQENTGGVAASLNFNIQAADHTSFHPTLHIRGKALHRKAAKLFSLLHEAVIEVNLKDIRRLKEVILKHFSGLESALNQNALKYAVNLSASGISAVSKVANDLYGLNYYFKVRDLVNHFDDEAENLVERLEQMRKKVIGLQHPHLVLTCSSAMYDEFKHHGFYGLSEMIVSPFAHWSSKYPLQKVSSQGRVIASPVAFIAKVFETVSYDHPDAPALNIASFLLDNLSLHTVIREQGGAYGGGSVCNSLAGSFYFYSYRDPNIASTFKAFEEAIIHLINGDFDESDLEEAKLEMIQSLDTPISPGSRAEVAYSWLREGRTYDRRQQFRNQLLNLTKEMIIDVAKRRIEPKLKTGAAVVFAGKELLERENIRLIKESEQPLVIETI